MSALPHSQPKTLEELIELEASGYKRYEIVNDEFVELGVSRNSSFTNAQFSHFLVGHAYHTGLGQVFDSEMIYELPLSTRHADVSFIAIDRIPKDDQAAFTGAPDIVVEVVSPSDRSYDVRAKVQEWLDAGARLVWLALPKSREVTVYRRGERPKVLTESDVLEGEDVLPGFAVEVRRLFPPATE